MSDRLTASDLDDILALQLSVAWAGEAAGNPPRLGWWNSDLVDPEGGGDLFARLVPKTAAWASLALVRSAARRVDASARESLATGDTVWSLFHFGFRVDEQLTDRLAYHRTHQHQPREVFGERLLVGQPWSTGLFETYARALGQATVEKTPNGRRLKVGSSSPVEAARLLTAALVPLVAAYPLPFVEN